MSALFTPEETCRITASIWTKRPFVSVAAIVESPGENLFIHWWTTELRTFIAQLGSVNVFVLCLLVQSGPILPLWVTPEQTAGRLQLPAVWGVRGKKGLNVLIWTDSWCQITSSDLSSLFWNNELHHWTSTQWQTWRGERRSVCSLNITVVSFFQTEVKNIEELYTTKLFCSGSEGCRTKPNDGRGPTAGEPRKEPLQQHPAMWERLRAEL